MEIIVIGAILLFIFFYNNTIDKDKFFADNQKYLEALKEDDYQFLVYARYGEDVDINQLYSKRVSTAALSKSLTGYFDFWEMIPASLLRIA